MMRWTFWTLAVGLVGGTATAEQPPWAGGVPPVGQLYGYSPLNHSIDPFPSKTSPYYHSMFHPVYGGKRVSPFLLTDPRRPPVVIQEAPTVVTEAVPAAPAAVALPTQPTVVAAPPVERPRLLRALPRPGPWLARAKAFLALPMYGAGLWLGWVFLRQAGASPTIWLAVAAIFVGAALWLYGRRQTAEAEGWRRRPALAGVILLAVLSVAAGTWATLAPRAAGAGSASALASREWSAQAVTAALEGEPSGFRA